MNIQELIDLLQTAEDKTIEVVVREGNNHGANTIHRSSYWSANDNPNYTNHIDPADYLLPDDDNGEYEVLVLRT